MKINLEGYELEGTPAEMLQLLDLLADEVVAVEKPAPDPDRVGCCSEAEDRAETEEGRLGESCCAPEGRLELQKDR